MQEMPRSNEKVETKPEETKVGEKKKVPFFRWFFESFIWLGVLLFIIDVVTKSVANSNLTYGESVKIPGLEWLVQLTLTFNTGAAWGMGGDNLVTQILLCVISYAAAIAIIIYLVKKYNKMTKFLRAVLIVCLAGDIGNLIDRTFALFPSLPTIYQHGVIDFIDITPLIKGFGIFNFADSCLVVGLAMLIVYEIVISIKEDVKKKPKENNEKK